MNRYGRKWTEDIDRFILAEIPIARKDDLLNLINAIFETNFTRNALTTHCTEKRIQLGIKPWQNNCGKFRGREPKPIDAEIEKKGYIKIKVAQPNEWRFKHHVVWDKTHPEDPVQKYETVLFLDGNNRNFNPENLAKISRRLMVRLNDIRCAEDTPEDVLLKIEIVKLQVMRGDKAREIGYVTPSGAIRDTYERYLAKTLKHREELAKEWMRQKLKDPAFRERYNAKQREYRRKKKSKSL